jgi:hypothetical protein
MPREKNPDREFVWICRHDLSERRNFLPELAEAECAYWHEVQGFKKPHKCPGPVKYRRDEE